MNKQQLANKIWEFANKMRSKKVANQYKDYMKKREKKSRKEAFSYLYHQQFAQSKALKKISRIHFAPLRKVLVGFVMIGTFFSAILCNKRNLRSILNPFRPTFCYRYFEVVVTTRCSLKCRYCSNLMQYYAHPYHVPLDTVIRSIDRLVGLCDYIAELRIIGGEPFMYRELPQVLEHVLSIEKIKQIGIPTNGTIPLTDQRLIHLLQNKRVILDVSNYGYEKTVEFCQTLIDNKIRFIYCTADRLAQDRIAIENPDIKAREKLWDDPGSMERRNRDEKALSKQFLKCLPYCRSILNGVVYYCPRSGHGADLNAIPLKSDEYIDLLNDESPADAKRLSKLYYRLSPITACNYCDAATENIKAVAAGKDQLKKPLPISSPLA